MLQIPTKLMTAKLKKCEYSLLAIIRLYSLSKSFHLRSYEEANMYAIAGNESAKRSLKMAEQTREIVSNASIQLKSQEGSFSFS